MDKKAGFFSIFFFNLNHCIYSKIHNTNLKIISNDWLFKYNTGWEDYFEPYEINSYDKKDVITKGHSDILEEYPIQYYKDIIPSVYRYNNKTKINISVLKDKLKLPYNYDSIFIRRGDKIISGESKYESADKYMDLLIKKNPFTKCIYVQTDDYNVIDEINGYISRKNMNIEIKTLCEKDQRGIIVKNNYKNDNININRTETEYINKNKDILKKAKSVDEMNPDEIYNHVILMISGIDIVCKSNICISDYQSNVGRFIKLFHINSNKVYSIDNPDSDIDYSKKICPAFSF